MNDEMASDTDGSPIYKASEVGVINKQTEDKNNE